MNESGSGHHSPKEQQEEGAKSADHLAASQAGQDVTMTEKNQGEKLAMGNQKAASAEKDLNQSENQ